MERKKQEEQREVMRQKKKKNKNKKKANLPFSPTLSPIREEDAPSDDTISLGSDAGEEWGWE